MKTINLFTIWIFLLTICIQAQDVKHQSEIIKNTVYKGDYKIIADKYKSHGGVMTITDIQMDKSRPNDHFEISFKKYPNHAAESTRNTVIRLFADDTAFPVTYMQSNYEGNGKLQKAVGYVVREGKSVGDERFVFVDDYLFFLSDWKSKDDYSVRFILKFPETTTKDSGEKTKKKKKGGFFKKLKQGLKEGSTGSEEKIKKLKAEVLQPYLNKATAQQKSQYATWIKDPKNVKLKKHIADTRVLMDKAMKKYNDDIFNSPEHQRMLAFNKWYKNNKVMTVHNKTGRRIWVGSSKNAHITTGIDNGHSRSISCSSDMYYYFIDENRTPGTKFYTADTACGSSVTIN
ncbi:hypothetical protein [Winogradskyella sp. 4-2091]|uniref:hypothetical protein n=1 Tax=Winogradskyella sp. 4-2091 TaxID=3381659 RepID=UPI003891F772